MGSEHEDRVVIGAKGDTVTHHIHEPLGVPTARGIERGPITHFFYEHGGERETEVLTLMRDAKELWDEQIYTDETQDLQYIWSFAKELIEKRKDSTSFSFIEDLRYRIILGDLAPSQWKKQGRYPHKGLLISACYLLEAELLYRKGDQQRIWQVLAMTYYYLGVGTGHASPSNLRLKGKATQAALSEEKAIIVFEALKLIAHDPKIKTISKAKEAVLNVIRGNPSLLKRLELDDRISPQSKNYSSDNDALERLQRSLDRWTVPNGPYPVIYEEFARFDTSKQLVTREFVSDEERTTHTRIYFHGDAFDQAYSFMPKPV